MFREVPADLKFAARMMKRNPGFAAVAAGFVVVATIACLVPALRAARVNPVIILKAE